VALGFVSFVALLSSNTFRTMKNRPLIISASVAIVLVVGLVVAKKQGWIGGPPPQKVAAEAAAVRTVVETVSASGRIQSEVEVVISPDVPGEIIFLNLKEGDKVKEGQLLLKIDPDIQRSNVERLEAALNTAKANLANAKSRSSQAEAQFVNAQASFDRTTKLFNDKVVPQSEMDAARSSHEVARNEVEAAKQSVEAAKFNVRSAEAGLKEADKNLNRTEIYSPVTGTVSKLNFKKGERVVGTSQMMGSEVMKIADLNGMEVVVEVNENDIIRVGLGDSCDIEVDAYLGRKFKGVVTSIANSAKSSGMGTDQVTNFEVKARILRTSYEDLTNDKQPGASPFRPGMSATVDIRTRTERDVLTVPIQCVATREVEGTEKAVMHKKGEGDDEQAAQEEEEMTDGSADQEPVLEAEQEEVAFVVREGKAHRVKVATGIQDGQYIRITEGLQAGDMVITAPYRLISKTLKDGDPVEVVPMDELYGKNEEGGGPPAD
jgi:HlyD family secretion protein